MNRKLGIILLCLVLSTLTCFVTWEWSGAIQPSLNPSLLPTAQYLAQNPQPTPVYIKSIVPALGRTIGRSEKICITLLPGELVQAIPSGDEYARLRDTVARNTRIVLNDVPVPRINVDIVAIFVAILSDRGATDELNVCFKPNLEIGLHLVTLQTSPSLFDLLGGGNTQSYTWMYEVR